MSAKIRVRVGEVEIEYEGAESFLDKKLPELVTQLSKLADRLPAGPGRGGSAGGPAGTARDPGPLGTFLKGKNATQSQKRRFLATAQWLHSRGNNRLRTRDVTKALKDNNQARIGNPSETLSQNVADGFIEKSGSEFFVTDQGRGELG